MGQWLQIWHSSKLAAGNTDTEVYIKRQYMDVNFTSNLHKICLIFFVNTLENSL